MLLVDMLIGSAEAQFTHKQSLILFAPSNLGLFYLSLGEGHNVMVVRQDLRFPLQATKLESEGVEAFRNS